MVRIRQTLAGNPERVSMLRILLNLAWNPERESMLSILFGNLASNPERRTCSEISKSGMENPSDGACTVHLKLGVKPREGKHA